MWMLEVVRKRTGLTYGVRVPSPDAECAAAYGNTSDGKSHACTPHKRREARYFLAR